MRASRWSRWSALGMVLTAALVGVGELGRGEPGRPAVALAPIRSTPTAGRSRRSPRHRPAHADSDRGRERQPDPDHRGADPVSHHGSAGPADGHRDDDAAPSHCCSPDRPRSSPTRRPTTRSAPSATRPTPCRAATRATAPPRRRSRSSSATSRPGTPSSSPTTRARPWTGRPARSRATARWTAIRAAEHVLSAAPASDPGGDRRLLGRLDRHRVRGRARAELRAGARHRRHRRGRDPDRLAHNLAYINGSPGWSGVIPAVLIGLAAASSSTSPSTSRPTARGRQPGRGQCINNFLGAYPGLTYQKLLGPKYQNIFAIPAFVRSPTS